MPIKLIAADLDGTLLNESSLLSDYSLEVLTRCAAQGIKIAAATGRAFSAMPQCVRECPHIDYAITSNGAAIYALPQQRLLQHYVLNPHTARRLADYALENRFGLELICQGKAYGEKYYFEHPEAFLFNQRSLDYLHNTRTKIENLEDFLTAHIDSLESIDFVLPKGVEKDKIEAQFCKDTSLYITSSHSRILEFSAAGCGKANALRYLLKAEHIGTDSLACFGNAENDLEMIDLAAVGVATANSPAEVLEKAPFHCDSCNADGVAKFIAQHFLL